MYSVKRSSYATNKQVHSQYSFKNMSFFKRGHYATNNQVHLHDLFTKFVLFKEVTMQ